MTVLYHEVTEGFIAIPHILLDVHEYLSAMVCDSKTNTMRLALWSGLIYYMYIPRYRKSL